MACYWSTTVYETNDIRNIGMASLKLRNIALQDELNDKGVHVNVRRCQVVYKTKELVKTLQCMETLDGGSF